MKQLKFIAIICLLFISGAYNAPSAVAQSNSELIQNLKREIDNAQWQLPVKDGIVELYEVKFNNANNTVIYRYRFTIPMDKPTQAELRERKASMVHLIKGSPQSEDARLIKAGVTFHYNYYDNNGNFMYAMKISKSDL